MDSYILARTGNHSDPIETTHSQTEHGNCDVMPETFPCSVLVCLMSPIETGSCLSRCY